MRIILPILVRDALRDASRLAVFLAVDPFCALARRLSARADLDFIDDFAIATNPSLLSTDTTAGDAMIFKDCGRIY